MLCLLGLEVNKVGLLQFRHSGMWVTCKRKGFWPLVKEPLLGALPKPPWSPRYSNQGSHSEQLKSQNWSNNNWAPSTRMSKWRGCSPWLLLQLLFQTSSLDSPCPRFKIIPSWLYMFFQTKYNFIAFINHVLTSVGDLSQSDTIEMGGKPSGPS